MALSYAVYPATRSVMVMDPHRGTGPRGSEELSEGGTEMKMAYYGVQNFDRPVEAANTVKTLPGYNRLSIENKARLAQAEAIADAVIAVSNFVSKAAAALYAPVKAWRIQLRTREELDSLDDRALADIGLTRGDIRRVAAGLWVPENRSAQIAFTVPVAASNFNKPQIAA